MYHSLRKKWLSSHNIQGSICIASLMGNSLLTHMAIPLMVVVKAMLRIFLLLLFSFFSFASFFFSSSSSFQWKRYCNFNPW